jgi:monothiol bacilliredoxin
MTRVTLPERTFTLQQPDDVEGFLAAYPWCVVFKAGTSDKTIDAWQVMEKALEPRPDVPVGVIRLPADRAASDRVSAFGIAHRSPQFALFHDCQVRFHLDEFAITPDRLVPLLQEHLPASAGPPVRNPAVVSLAPYRALAFAFVSGTLPEERFQWAYLERLEQEAAWRDDETFAMLGELFESPLARDFRAAAVVAREFQSQLAGRREPLKDRAARLLGRLERAVA